MKVLNQNQYGYSFFTHLFFAYLQGDAAVESISKQLKAIEKVKHHFDIVVIVRGGGGEVGLACYNNYELCKSIAECSLPVLTGIGHSTNLTVAEMIAYRNAITPTELGEFLLQTFHEFSVPVEQAFDQIQRSVKILLERSNSSFSQSVKQLKSNVQKNLLGHHVKWQRLSGRLNTKSELAINRQHERIGFIQKNMKTIYKRFQIEKLTYLNDSELFLKQNSSKTILKKKEDLIFLERQISMLDPKNVLKRGFSIAKLAGKSIGNENVPEVNQEIEIITYDYVIKTTTTSVEEIKND